LAVRSDVLAPENLDTLTRFAQSRVLVVFDFDGTLAPIVSDRDAAAMRTQTRERLARLCDLYPVAVLSGRGVRDLSPRLAGLGLRHVVGNHGLEPGSDLATLRRHVEVVRPQLETALASSAGLEIEDKTYTLAVHYRGARSAVDARRAIHDAVARLTVPMRIVPGKHVVNLISEDAPHKGDAVIRMREGYETAIYVGDDVTDEDVFALDQPGRLLSVRIGASASSAARYFLRDQGEIDGFLERLADLRTR
jgi:trehalose 6-phosphate phosphatase